MEKLFENKEIQRSFKKFDESSDKSSKKMIDLTYAIYVFTIIVAVIPLIEKILQLNNRDDPLSWISGYLLGIIIIVAVMYIYKKRVWQ